MELVRIWLVVLAGGLHEHASYRDRCICGGGVRNPVFHRKKAFREVGHQSQGDPGEDDVFSPGLLAMRVSDLSRECSLSPREEEVLQLLARKGTTAEIEENLFVARGTVKAHTSRIYRKLGVHSREELYELLGIAE